MRIQRLHSVRDFRVFKGWCDEESKRPHRFGQQTLIFGPNGSGKSTFADIAWAINRRQQGGETDRRLGGVEIEISDEDATTTVPASSDKVPPVYVFSKNYIDANLRRAFEEGTEGTALYVIGQRDSELEDQIDEAEREYEDAKVALEDKKAAETENQRRRDSVLDAVKADVADDLQSYNPGQYNPTKFNKTKARTLLRRDRRALESDELAEARKNLQLTETSLPSEVNFESPTFPQPLIDAAHEVLSYNVTSKVIESLADNPTLSKWVHQGLSLHEDASHCGFCNQPLPSGRMTELEAHFDATHTELIRKLDKLEELVVQQEDRIARAKEQASFLPQVSTEIAQVLDDHSPQFEAYWNEAASWMDEIKSMIRYRRDAPHRPYQFTLSSPPDSTLWQEIDQKVREFNQDVQEKRNSISEVRMEAEQAILAHLAAKHSQEFDNAESNLQQSTEAKESATKRLARAEEALNQLRAQRASEHDGQALAQALTEDLAAYLGHSELSVEFVREEARAGFEFRRRGQPAKYLSEGERNAIALLHFLHSLDSIDVSRDFDEACLVIDDPVSSLDQDAILSAFTFLVSRLRNEDGSLRCNQLIILTHNFEFFRLWKDALRKPIEKDVRDARDSHLNVWNIYNRRASIVELLIRVDLAGQDAQRMPLLRDFSVGIGALTSEYYYLFARACESTYHDGEELLPLTGNATRRLLESFLKFKLPDEVHFVNAAKRLGCDANMDRATVDRVVKALHGASHRTEIDIHTPAYRSQVVNEIMAALRFIEKVDSVHFEGMCKATGARPSYCLPQQC